MAGLFITLEGIDGSGKSSHIPAIKDLLETQGFVVTSTREPGGTPIGERLRELLLNQSMSQYTELMLMFAARHEHLEKVIHPALARGEIVISDRFSDSSYAFQSGGRGMPEEVISDLDNLVTGGFKPDLTLLFDVNIGVANTRMGSRDTLDRFEQEGEAFHQKVRNAYLMRAAAEPWRFHIIDSSQPIERVREDALQAIRQFIMRSKA